MPTVTVTVFHSRAAATGKARSPMDERRVRVTTSDDVDAERRRWRASSADDWWNSSARYGGAVWCGHLRVTSLKTACSKRFNDCSGPPRQLGTTGLVSPLPLHGPAVHALFPRCRARTNIVHSHHCLALTMPRLSGSPSSVQCLRVMLWL